MKRLFGRLALAIIFLICIFCSGAEQEPPAYAWCASSDESAGNMTLEEAEWWLVDYINRLRVEPEDALAELGLEGSIPPQSRTELVCNWYGCFQQNIEMSPLARSAFLDKIAVTWAENMAQDNAVSYVSSDGLTIYDELVKEGYPSSNGTEIISALLIREFQDPCWAVRALMLNMVGNDISGEEGSTGNVAKLVNFDYNAIGLALRPLVFRMPDDSMVGAYVLVIVIDRPAEPFEGRIIQCGHVFKDMNGNGRYDEGEGLSDVVIQDSSGPFQSFTYKNGRFCIERPEEEGSLVVDGRWISNDNVQSMPFWTNGELRQDICLDQIVN